MMHTKRWIVTYTRHMTQKRKVYHDGVLEMCGSSGKVMLYDDCEKLLDNRFLKPGEVAECGASLAFETHLVDIGEAEGKDEHQTGPSAIGRDMKLNERATAQGHKKTMVQSISQRNYSIPMHGSTRDNKKRKLQSIPSQIPSPTIPSSIREWDALYTTQITQKAKKFHDGIVQLAVRGLHMTEVTLLSEDRTVLSSKYLKSVDCIGTGYTCELPNYLVEIGDPRVSLGDDIQKGPSKEIASSGRSSTTHFTFTKKNHSINTLPNDNLQKGHLQQVSSSCNSSTGEFTITKEDNSNKGLHNEWDVLYTTQKVQKAKKYHDGIIRLAVRSSHMNQAILLSEDGTVLSSKYLKSVDCLDTGNTCEFPNYLVEIGDPRSSFGDDLQKGTSKQVASSGSSSNPQIDDDGSQKDRLKQISSSRSSSTGKFTPTRKDDSNKTLDNACQISFILKKLLREDNHGQTIQPAGHDTSSYSSIIDRAFASYASTGKFDWENKDNKSVDLTKLDEELKISDASTCNFPVCPNNTTYGASESVLEVSSGCFSNGEQHIADSSTCLLKEQMGAGSNSISGFDMNGILNINSTIYENYDKNFAENMKSVDRCERVPSSGGPSIARSGDGCEGFEVPSSPMDLDNFPTFDLGF